MVHTKCRPLSILDLPTWMIEEINSYELFSYMIKKHKQKNTLIWPQRFDFELDLFL